MLENDPSIENKYVAYLDYGIHKYEINSQSHYLVSFPTFSELIKELMAGHFDPDSIIVTPELITIAGGELDQQEVIQKLEQVFEFSKNNPTVKIILGSPYWFPNSERPANCALVIIGGEVKQIIRKRNLTYIEEKDFETVVQIIGEGNANEIIEMKDTSLIICRDLAVEGAILKDSEVNTYDLINTNTKALIVIACWGFGSKVPRSTIARMSKIKNGESNIEDYVDALFEFTIQQSIDGLVRKYPNIKTIIICDRAPLNQGKNPEDSITSSRPFNRVYNL